MTIKDSDIEDIINMFVIIANRDGALRKVADQYPDDRSLGIKILGSRYNSGFVFQDGIIKILDKLDDPTVTISLDKKTFWDVMNSESVGIGRAKLVVGIFTEESVWVDPPPGIGGGMIQLENLLDIFTYISKHALG